MHAVTKILCAGILLAAALYAGPLEFGLADFDAALQARGMRPRQIRLRCELGDLPAESWRIDGTLITGGDLRGLMYGLLEAAAQVRVTGRISQARGSAAVGMRGVRLTWNAQTQAADQQQWRAFVEMLSRSRINRLHLVVAEPEHHLEFLKNLSILCANHGVDLAVGFPEAAADGPAIHERIEKVVSHCPLVRSVNVRVAGDPDAEFYRQWVTRAADEAGRLVAIELPGAPAGVEGPKVRRARLYREDISGGTGEYFEVPSPLEQGAPVWADPMWVRYVASVVERSGSEGFEIEAPWPWEAHWAFYLMWGRVGYYPRIADRALAGDFEQRAGKALGSDLFKAWSAASRAFSLAALLSPGRWVATADEAERMAREGTGSGKLTPTDISIAVSEAIADAKGALARIPVEDARQIEVLLASALARTAPVAASVATRPPRPQVQHYPPKVAPSNIAFPLGVSITPSAQVKAVRLHYRVGEETDFHTMEAPPARAWFSVKAAGNLTYYFEILTRDNKGWFHPDPLAGSPFFHLPVRVRRTEPVNEPDGKSPTPPTT